MALLFFCIVLDFFKIFSRRPESRVQADDFEALRKETIMHALETIVNRHEFFTNKIAAKVDLTQVYVCYYSLLKFKSWKSIQKMYENKYWFIYALNDFYKSCNQVYSQYDIFKFLL
jgi:hypothetical protein